MVVDQNHDTLALHVDSYGRNSVFHSCWPTIPARSWSWLIAVLCFGTSLDFPMASFDLADLDPVRSVFQDCDIFIVFTHRNKFQITYSDHKCFRLRSMATFLVAIVAPHHCWQRFFPCFNGFIANSRAHYGSLQHLQPASLKYDKGILGASWQYTSLGDDSLSIT